ncbi:MAG TPA: hypothetical protein VIJ47_13895 [Acidimicrobiales bacterium]
MLDHDEERRLAEIEHQFRLDDPEWLGQFEASVEPHPSAGQPYDRSTDDPEPVDAPHPVVRSILALSTAVVVTALVTLAFGPNLGGLVAVLSLCTAGMYAYQLLRGCPGLRSPSGDDD